MVTFPKKEWSLANVDVAAGQRPYLFKRYSISQLRRKLERGAFCVACYEEGIYRLWLWFPQCSPAEAEERWRNAPAWGYEWRKYLGGRWMSEREYTGEAYAKGAQATKFARLLETRSDAHKYYTAYLCCDRDSHLQAPDGRSITHAGFNGQDWYKQPWK